MFAPGPNFDWSTRSRPDLILRHIIYNFHFLPPRQVGSKSWGLLRLSSFRFGHHLNRSYYFFSLSLFRRDISDIIGSAFNYRRGHSRLARQARIIFLLRFALLACALDSELSVITFPTERGVAPTGSTRLAPGMQGD